MELDEFKQRIKGKVPEERGQSADELGTYIRSRTVSSLQKIKRSMLFELIACGAFIAISIAIFIIYHISYVRVFCLLAIFLCCFLVAYLAALHRKISLYEKNMPAVREGLLQVIEIVETFTKLYFQFTMITLPIAFIFGLITGFLSLGGMKGFNWQKALFFYTCCFLFWSIIMYFFSKWYIRKLYGNYLAQLRDQIKDIENG